MTNLYLCYLKRGDWPSGPAPAEQDLVRELVFVSQGIEGSLITHRGGNYTPDKKVAMSTHQKSIVIKLCKVRWLYRLVHSFMERQVGEVS
jgi:hypothetical protein